MQALGLAATKLRRHMMDTGRGAPRRRERLDAGRARAAAAMLDARRRAAPASRDAALTLLKKPKESRLRKGLPAGVETADKPGELEGVRVDAGIVFAKNRPYVLCVMTTYLKSEAEGERAIVEISRAAYEYFSRLGVGRAQYGREIQNSRSQEFEKAAPNRGA